MRRAVSAAALVAALVAGHWLTTNFETGTGGNAPFVHTVGVGEVARLSYADVRARDVRPAHRLLGTLSTALATQASGVYVVATVELTATREPTTFLTIRLLDDEDRAYLPSIKSECRTPPSSDTGVTTYAMLCFEVPADRLAGLRLQIARGDDGDDTLRHDDVAEISLGVSTADEQEWAATTAAYGVAPTATTPFLPQPAVIIEEPEPTS